MAEPAKPHEVIKGGVVSSADYQTHFINDRAEREGPQVYTPIGCAEPKIFFGG